MSRAIRRKAVRRMAKAAFLSKQKEIEIQLPKGSFNYFEKEVRKYGGKG